MRKDFMLADDGMPGASWQKKIAWPSHRWKQTFQCHIIIRQSLGWSEAAGYRAGEAK
jgi:hypothetical protein